MISGYSQAGRFNEALEPFGKLESLGVHTDEVTMVVVLTASSGPGAWILAKGRSSMILGYAREGEIDRARQLFAQME
ncbi:hypothetical protein WN944_003595 [Citrus x changshan-huyou]|uniref:Uncharacterized protein n=1 Tax=Citrus x changshan-huyou TaxID=2935761 RepID=A0AAP0LYU0_9ROSI